MVCGGLQWFVVVCGISMDRVKWNSMDFYSGRLWFTSRQGYTKGVNNGI